MSASDDYADSPTPITDAALCIYGHPNDLLGWPEGQKAQFMGEHIVPARVCRQLERELAEARSMTEGQWLLKVAARLVTAGCKSDGIVDAMDELIQQRDTLAEALEMVTTHNPVDNQCDNGYSPRYVAKQALAAVKGGDK